MSEWRPTTQKQASRAEARQLTKLLADAAILLGSAMVDMPRYVPVMRDAADGIGSSFGGGGVSGGDRSDPTLGKALARLDGGSDRATQRMDQVSHGVREIHRLAELIYQHIGEDLVDRAPLPPKCKNANGCPANHPPDPGRGGRCEACARYYTRNGEDREAVGGTKGVAA